MRFCNGRVQSCGVKVSYCFAVYGIVAAGRGSVGSCDVMAKSCKVPFRSGEVLYGLVL